MKIDKEKLNALAALPDAELWAQIRRMTEGYGINLPEKTPPKEELQKLRALFSDTNKLNLFGAMKIINDYKRGNK